jgi:hypothetical protein
MGIETIEAGTCCGMQKRKRTEMETAAAVAAASAAPLTLAAVPVTSDKADKAYKQQTHMARSHKGHRTESTKGTVSGMESAQRRPRDICECLDTEKTHKGYVVVSNNGGPRQVMPLETAPFHSGTRTYRPPPTLSTCYVTDEPDDDEIEAMMEADEIQERYA